MKMVFILHKILILMNVFEWKQDWDEKINVFECHPLFL